jgi:hypothetical protein
MQIIMMVALMFLLKTVILCFTWHACMVISRVCRLTLLSPLAPVVIGSDSVCLLIASYSWNVKLAWNAKMKKVLFLFMMLVLEVFDFWTYSEI